MNEPFIVEQDNNRPIPSHAMMAQEGNNDKTEVIEYLKNRNPKGMTCQGAFVSTIIL